MKKQYRKWMVLWTCALMLCALGVAKIQAQDFTSDLEAYWSFDEYDGGDAVDESGNSRDAVIKNGQPIPAAGKVGNGVFFDGSSNMNVDWTGVQGDTPRTISMWMKTTGGGPVFISWGNDVEGEKWHFRINDNAGNGNVDAIRTEYAGGNQTVATSPVNDGEWHLICSVFEGVTPHDVMHYVDGVLDPNTWVQKDETVINTVSDDAHNVHIASTDGDGRMFTGTMDEVRIYSRALSADEIKTLYDQGKPQQAVAVRSFSKGFAAESKPVEVTLNLPIPKAGELVEELPDGWTASDISDGGALSGSTITWNLTDSVTSVSYTAAPEAGTTANVFSGALDGLITDGANIVTVLQSGVGDLEFQADVGDAEAEGQASLNGTEYSVVGSGSDVWGTFDGFHFLFNELEGPFTMKGNAFIIAFDFDGHDWMKGGLMVRNNLTGGSSYGYNLVRGVDQQLASQARSSQGSSAFTVQDLTDDQFGDMEIQRMGKVIKFFRIDAAGERQPHGEVLLEDLEDPVYAGIATTSHSNGNLAQTLMLDFEIELIPFSANRSITAIDGGPITFGDTAQVGIEVFQRNQGSFSLTEEPPAGWEVSGVEASVGEASLNGDGEIVWTIDDHQGEAALTYEIATPSESDTPEITGEFSGEANGNDVTGDTSLSVQGIVSQAILDQQDITSGLVGHWTFDDGSGAVAADSSGSGRDAEVLSGDPEWVDGVKGTALLFDGEDDSLFVPDWWGLEGNTPRTVTCWIKSTATNTHGIVSWGLSGGNGQKYHVRINENAGNGTAGALRTEIQGSFNIATTIINDDEWHFISSVFPAGGEVMVDVQHFIDGLFDDRSGTNASGETLALDTAASPDLSDQEFRIGMRVQGDSDHYYPGLIDEVRVYERGLTPLEIQAVFMADGGPQEPVSVMDYMLY